MPFRIVAMWVFLSLLAAVSWGLNYVSAERLLARVSPFTLLAGELLVGCVSMFLLAWDQGSLLADGTVLINDRSLWPLLALSAGSFIAGNLCIALSIAAKNATLAGLVEISYPLFIALFSWSLFGSSHLSRPVVLGGLLIFAGVALIYFTG